MDSIEEITIFHENLYEETSHQEENDGDTSIPNYILILILTILLIVGVYVFFKWFKCLIERFIKSMTKARRHEVTEFPNDEEETSIATAASNLSLKRRGQIVVLNGARGLKQLKEAVLSQTKVDLFCCIRTATESDLDEPLDCNEKRGSIKCGKGHSHLQATGWLK